MALFSLQTPSQLSILQLLINDFLTLLLNANAHANTSVPYELLNLITCKILEWTSNSTSIYSLDLFPLRSHFSVSYIRLPLKPGDLYKAHPLKKEDVKLQEGPAVLWICCLRSMISPYPSADQEAKPLVKVELVQSCMRSMMGMDWVDVEETWALGQPNQVM